MDFFEKLELNRLMKELDFIDSDLIYKTSLLKKADEGFISNVNNVLDTFPDLKRIIDEKNNQRFANLNTQVISNIPIEEPIDITTSEELVITDNKPTKLKSLYRQIAKSTHPDKNDQDNLKEVYILAQKAYESNDLIQILSICDSLKISYEVTMEEFSMIKEEIDIKKKRINFLESTYTWKWFQEPQEDEKNRIILHYLESQISK